MSRYNFIVQRATTGEFLEWDLPLTVDTTQWQLSGSGSLSGSLTPDVGGLRTDDGHLLIEEWGTFIYAEADDAIHWGGIVVSCSFEGDSWNLECAGFSTYPHGLPYSGTYSKIQVDPVDAVKEIWRHVQAYPDGNLGVSVTGDTTPARLGEAAYSETVVEDGKSKVVPHEAEPYTLTYFDHPDCGQEIDTLAKEAPFDWVESHRWDEDHEHIIHEIRVGYPRLGRRREDLSFVEGDNVSNVISVESNGDTFANAILGLGAGEGRAMLRRDTAVRDGRLRRVYAYSDKAVTNPARMDSLISDELNYRRSALRITSVTVKDHPNAPIGAWELGDDVLVRAEIPWLGEIDLWVRITAWALVDESTATLTVSRSDLFRYGG